MKLTKKFLSLLTIAFLLLTFAPIMLSEIPGAYVVEASSVKINAKSKTLNVGNTYTLKISGTKKKIKWSSSKKSVATVNSKGKVTAKKKGTAIITAKIGNKKYTCKITVKKPSSSKTVYITKTGKKYHSSSCSYLRKSKIKISLKDAKARKYTACSRCKP